jgi:hypothetical protein
MCQEGIPSLTEKGPLNETLRKIVEHDDKVALSLSNLKVIDLGNWKIMKSKRRNLVDSLLKGAKR